MMRMLFAASHPFLLRSVTMTPLRKRMLEDMRIRNPAAPGDRQMVSFPNVPGQRPQKGIAIEGASRPRKHCDMKAGVICADRIALQLHEYVIATLHFTPIETDAVASVEVDWRHDLGPEKY
jgi:hypothetical protein